MKRNPPYEIVVHGGVQVAKGDKEDMTEVMSDLVTYAMGHTFAAVVFQVGDPGAEERFIECVVKPITRKKVGKRRSVREGLAAFTGSLLHPGAKYEVFSLRSMFISELNIERVVDWQSRGKQTGIDNLLHALENMLPVFVVGGGRSRLGDNEQNAKDALAKAASVALEDGVSILGAYGGAGDDDDYQWEVWVNSMDRGFRSPKSSSRLTYTYGEMPSAVAFERQFEKEIGDGGVYPITNRGGMGPVIPRGSTKWSAPELWWIVREMAAIYNGHDPRSKKYTIVEESGDTVGAILDTLGIEWI